MMIVQASDLPFVSITRSTCLNNWELNQLKVNVVFAVHVHMDLIEQFISISECL